MMPLACGDASHGVSPYPAQQAKRQIDTDAEAPMSHIVDQFYEAIRTGDTALLDSVIAEDFCLICPTQDHVPVSYTHPEPTRPT